MLDNYIKADSWLDTPEINENIFKNLENIMIDNNELDSLVNFNDLVYDINKN